VRFDHPDLADPLNKMPMPKQVSTENVLSLAYRIAPKPVLRSQTHGQNSPLDARTSIFRSTKALAADSALRCPKERTHELTLILSAREFDDLFNDDGEVDSADGEDRTYIDAEDGPDDIELADLDRDVIELEQ
jgi:hypothetical protein